MRHWIALTLLITACDMGTPPPEPEPQKVVESPAAKVDRFGQAVTAAQVPLGQIAKAPGAFKDKTIATSGTVTAVCQEQGCWLALADSGSQATVRMHAHAFFVPPKTTKGRKARVQGTVVMVKDGKECDDMAAQGASLELDATGVELE
jgi:hypothetical protein